MATFDPASLTTDLAPSSLAEYRKDWQTYTNWCTTHSRPPLSAESLAAWRATLTGDSALSSSTVNRRISGVKRLVSMGAAQGQIDAATAAQIGSVKGVSAQAAPAQPRERIRTRISPEDMRRLCNAPDTSTLRGKRDAALLAVLASSGVRISEAVNMRVGSLHQRGAGYFIHVPGQGQSDPRDAPLSREGYRLVQEWLAARPVQSDYVFTGWRGGRGGQGRPTDEPLTPSGAWQIVNRYAHAAGLENVKPHDFRRFVGRQLAARDLRQAQKALGHKRLDTIAEHYLPDELEPGLTDELY